MVGCYLMQTIISAKTIERLQTTFATHGLPWEIVTNNSPTFYKWRILHSEIVHIKTAAYHPVNELTECVVQTFKQGLKCYPDATIQVERDYQTVLFTFRTTPQMIMTGVSLSLHFRSHLNRHFPNLSDKAQTQQSKQTQQHDSTKPLKTLNPDDEYIQKTFLYFFCTDSRQNVYIHTYIYMYII